MKTITIYEVNGEFRTVDISNKFKITQHKKDYTIEDLSGFLNTVKGDITFLAFKIYNYFVEGERSESLFLWEPFMFFLIYHKGDNIPQIKIVKEKIVSVSTSEKCFDFDEFENNINNILMRIGRNKAFL